ncbi:unnamed protein product, partial [Brassica rapa]
NRCRRWDVNLHRVPTVELTFWYTPPVKQDPTMRLPREPGTRTIFTNRRTTPMFHPPSHQAVDLRWMRSPTEPCAIAVRGAPK